MLLLVAPCLLPVRSDALAQTCVNLGWNLDLVQLALRRYKARIVGNLELMEGVGWMSGERGSAAENVIRRFRMPV